MSRKPAYSKSTKSVKAHKVSKPFQFTKTNTCLPILIISVLYIACYFFAPTAPVFVVLQQIGSFVFGTKGMLFVAFAWLWYGALVRTKPWMIAQWARQFLLLCIFISAVVNMSLLSADNADYIKYGGYISFPVLEFGKLLFATNLVAIQWLILMGLLGTIVRILMTSNIELPSIPKVEFPSRSDYQSSNEHNSAQAKANLKNERYDWGQIINNPEKIVIKSDVYKQIAEQSKKEFSESSWWVDLKSLLKAKLLDKFNSQSSPEVSISVPKPIITFPKDKPSFPVRLLVQPNPDKWPIDDVYIAWKAELIKSKLAEFGIPVEIAWYNVGPAVVQIKLQPQSGVKYSAIEWLKNDLMGALKSKTLRILAPIVWTEYVWIEISNPSPSMVRLSEVLWSSEFVWWINENLTNLSLWKGIDGKLVIKSLEKMPHLLIAGATGQWKSVGVNDFILSLMFQNSPDEMRFIMVDPKQVEMELYSGLPYLLCPIITDPEKALRALKWATVEMDTRYGMLKMLRVKNLDEYNAKVETLPFDQQTTYTKMARIVIVIDELADLMMSGKKKDVELCITRIAQKARAVGMHLIVATQRPSVNVITGLIKANMPTRISFGVVSQIDSRTILDMKWAEDLIGKGDMLYVDPSSRYPIRIQAPFVDTPEIESVVTYIREKYMKWISEDDIYDEELVKLLEWKVWIGGTGISLSGVEDGDADDETLVQQAIELIGKSRRASTTALQRNLKIGFARAGRIMDILEERWIVWPQEGGRPREVLV